MMLITLKALLSGAASGHDETKGSGNISFCTLCATHFKTTPNIPPMKRNGTKASQLLIKMQIFQFATNFFDAEPETGHRGKGDFVLEHRCQNKFLTKVPIKIGKKSSSKHLKGWWGLGSLRLWVSNISVN